MAARSTTAGTPVKSCMRIRAGAKAISLLGSAVSSQPANASTSAGSTLIPSSLRSMFSSRTFREYGRRSTPPRESSRKISKRLPPTDRSALEPKLLWLVPMRLTPRRTVLDRSPSLAHAMGFLAQTTFSCPPDSGCRRISLLR